MPHAISAKKQTNLNDSGMSQIQHLSLTEFKNLQNSLELDTMFVGAVSDDLDLKLSLSTLAFFCTPTHLGLKTMQAWQKLEMKGQEVQ